MEAFGRFLDVLDELREKCPWDRKQTNESLRPNTIEETYELCDALMQCRNLTNKIKLPALHMTLNVLSVYVCSGPYTEQVTSTLV